MRAEVEKRWTPLDKDTEKGEGLALNTKLSYSWLGEEELASYKCVLSPHKQRDQKIPQ